MNKMLDSSSRVTFGTKITDRIWQDNNGQLICHDCIIARTGYYDYLESDVVAGGDENKIVKVYRSPEEVFNPKSMASFENKPFCNDHPDEDVSPENNRYLQCGFIRNIVRGKGPLDNCLLCDIIVTDPDVIELIKSGEKRELSLGYDTDIVERNGQYEMTNIRGNHLALVDSGRAGCATIRDNAIRFNKNLGGRKMFFEKNTAKLFDDNEDIIEVEELEEPAVEETDCGIMPETKHDDDISEKILAKLDEVLALLKEKTASEPTLDNVPEKTTVETTPEKTDEDISSKEKEENDLLDADEVLTEETEEQKEEVDSDEDIYETIGKKTDSNNVYSKFASSIDDSKEDKRESIRNVFQSRYNKNAGIKED